MKFLNLNIIGNGFDLYHGLPSSYYYFACYLIDKDPEFFGEIGKMYSLTHLTPVGPSIAHEFDYTAEDIFWREFEGRLGEVDEDFILYSYEDDLGLESDDPYDIEMNEDLRAERLKKFFVNWVKDTLDKKENFRIIMNYLQGKSEFLNINKKDYFVVFNYTHTLQHLYNVDDEMIHYVHGECFGNEDDELIIGHGNDTRIREIKKTIEELEEDYDYTQGTNNRINENRCLLRYIQKLRKDVQRHMESCRWFYRGIGKDIETITVYGLSMGEVDIPYLIQAREKWPNSKWKFSYYSDEDEARIEEIATEVLGLCDDEFITFEFKNTHSELIKNEIIEEHCINEY